MAVDETEGTHQEDATHHIKDQGDVRETHVVNRKDGNRGRKRNGGGGKQKEEWSGWVNE